MTIRMALCAVIFLLVGNRDVTAQSQSAPDQFQGMSSRLLQRIQAKVSKLNNSIDHQSEKYLQVLAKREASLMKKLHKDSAITASLSDNVVDEYEACLAKLKDSAAFAEDLQGEYLPCFDSLKSSLSFLQQYADKLPPSQVKQLQASLQNVHQLEAKFRQSAEVKAFLQGRKQQLAGLLSRHTGGNRRLGKELAAYQKEYYYYSQQLREYKETWKNPDRLQRKVFEIMRKQPAFIDFMKQHSALAALFRLPQDYGTDAALQGLQTRNDILQQLQGFAASGPNAEQLMRQNLQAANGALSQIKNKLESLGDDGEDIDMPGFKPNHQKTKSFLGRLEYGTDIQTQRSSNAFPTTTDIGLSVGYKLNDKSIAGVGMSYKMGWGRGFDHIAISHQGMGIRSFLDYKLKGTFYLSGGMEYNYQRPFADFGIISGMDEWQKSGLVGITKVISIKKGFLKKTTLQLLWDFLSYDQLPRTQPFKFRIGYKR